MAEGPDNQIQPFLWQKLDEFSKLLNRIGRHGFHSWPETPDELRSELEMLRLDPESDVALLRSNGNLCGYSLVVVESDIDRVVAAIGTTDECSGGAGKLLEFVIGRASAAGVSRIHIASRGVPAEPNDLLIESGFRQVASNIELTLEREEATGVRDAPLPDGFSIRPMRSFAETLLLTQVQNRVFENHWGFSKNTPEEIQAKLELPVTGPEQTLFVESAEGEIAGYVWTALEWQKDRTCGKVWMTGVVPEFRRLGLGQALVTAGIKHLLAEGAADIHLEVIEDNSAAVRIYEGLGFKKCGKATWYEKKV